MFASELKLGEQGIIEKVLDEEVYLKLLDMGCMPGETITIQFKAPLGDPIAIQVSGYTLSLRLQEAGKIQVKKV